MTPETTTTLARRNGHRADVAPAGSEWTADELTLIRQQAAASATEAEFAYLLYLARQYGLNPLLKEIWCVKFNTGKAQIYAARDGFLTIAHRSEMFNGMNTPVRVEPVPINVGGMQRAFQYVATCSVYNKAMTHPIQVEVWEEEYSTGRDLWKTKPRTMLAKVAECQALRKAFNISGLYDTAEINTDEAPARQDRAAPAAPPAPDPAFDEEAQAAAEWAAQPPASAAGAGQEPLGDADERLALQLRISAAARAHGLNERVVAIALKDRLHKKWPDITNAELAAYVAEVEQRPVREDTSDPF